MAQIHSPGIVTSNLKLALDPGNLSSMPGMPTTNLAYLQNPRMDSFYQSYMPYSGTGNMTANHPNAIRVYNVNGTDISDYVNTGITVENSGVSWENTRHAHWVYDNTLKKPVVQMYDTNNVWKAKSFNLNSGAWSTNGWGVGTKYTISWLQYTTDTTKSAYVGMYTRNSSNVYNFWDGLSFAYNTEVNTWQRVSATFTVTSSWDQTIDYNGIYMYGQYGNVPNTLRIADVQVEIKDAATNFSEAQTRSTTDVWKDTSGNSKHVTFVNSPTYSSSNGGSLVFDGTDDYCLGTELGQLTTYTIDVWFRPTSHPNNNACVISSVYPGSNNTVNFKIGYEGGSGMVGGFFDGGWRLSPSVSTTLNTWQNVVYTYNGSSLSIYSNGVSGGSTSYTGTPNSGGAGFRVGRRWDAADYFAGNIGVIKIYNRALSATEISQNFNAIRGRYGI